VYNKSVMKQHYNSNKSVMEASHGTTDFREIAEMEKLTLSQAADS